MSAILEQLKKRRISSALAMLMLFFPLILHVFAYTEITDTSASGGVQQVYFLTLAIGETI